MEYELPPLQLDRSMVRVMMRNMFGWGALAGLALGVVVTLALTHHL